MLLGSAVHHSLVLLYEPLMTFCLGILCSLPDPSMGFYLSPASTAIVEGPNPNGL